MKYQKTLAFFAGILFGGCIFFAWQHFYNSGENFPQRPENMQFPKNGSGGSMDRPERKSGSGSSESGEVISSESGSQIHYPTPKNSLPEENTSENSTQNINSKS